MAITSSQILSSNSLEELRQQFNNLQTDVTTLDSSGVSEIVVSANNSTNETVYPTFVDGATGAQGLESDTGLTYNPSTGVLTTTSVTGNLTGNVTGNTSGTAATVTTAAQSSITSLGTLTTLTVDSIIINGTNIGHTSDSDAIAISSGGVVTMDQIPVFSAGINVSGGTIAGTLATASQGNITTVGALDGGSITSGFGAIDNGTSNIRSATITAETAFVPDTSDGAALGTTALEFSDLYLADGGIIYFGDDQDINITHVADTGITTNGTFQATTITATTAFVPDASDGATLGTTSLEFSDLFLADGAVIYAGDDQDWQATHITDNEMRLADGDKWGFGAGGDLTIYHDGSNSYINDAGTGNLKIAGSQIDLLGGTDGGETMATFVDNGAVTLYYDNTAALATASAAVNVTGDLTATLTIQPAGDTAAGDNAAIGWTAGEGLILTGQGSSGDITLKNDAAAVVCYVPTGTDDLLFPDSAKVMWGAGSDLQIYHDGSNSYISDQGTGFIVMNSGEVRINNVANDETMARFVADGATSLYYDNTAALATASGGGTLTGSWAVTTALNPDASDGAALGTASLEWSDLYLADAAKIYFGADQDIQMTHTHNTGLTVTNIGTADNTPMVLLLRSEEDDIVANEVIASLQFGAGDSSGTDAAEVAAGIHAIAEGTFSASANATKLVFTTAVSETAAASATAKMTLSSAGALTVVSTVTCTPTSTLLIKDSSGSTLKTVYGVASN